MKKLFFYLISIFKRTPILFLSSYKVGFANVRACSLFKDVLKKPSCVTENESGSKRIKLARLELIELFYFYTY